MVCHNNYYKWFRFLFCMVSMKVKRLREGAVLPRYEHEGDAGMDISACGSFLEIGTNETKEFSDLDVYVLGPGKRVLVKSGIQVEGATLYCKMTPCNKCAQMIINSGIKRVVCEKIYHAAQDNEFYGKAGIKLDVVNESIEMYEGM